MQVMITGGTGFVGYHTALALMAAGHTVSLLVRNVDKMTKLYGDDIRVSYTQGDITDPEKVAACLRGCDAVVHAAAMVSTDASDAEEVFTTNVEGAKTVIGSALNLGIAPIIHVSSVTALFNPDAKILDENSPPGAAKNAYGRSKVACEEYVRERQAEGEHIYITYPASVIGPDAPGLTEPHIGMQTFLTAFVPLMSGGNQYVDVRDLAEVHLRLLEQQPEPGNYTLGGHYLSWPELAKTLEKITDRSLLKVPVLAGFMRMAGRVFDKVSPYLPTEVPMSEEAMEYATKWVKMDNGKVERVLDFKLRSVEDSMADTIRWLYRNGHVSEKHAGVLSKS
ncbi:MAG: SDR family NAD(P)-dependent oxidoreductase [Halioglobus sp.]